MTDGYFLSVDGGGTKLRMLLFDGDFRILGEGLRGGVNLNSTTEPDARENIGQCLEQVFANGAPAEINKLYCVFVGHINFLFEALNKITHVCETVALSEPEAGLLAGALWDGGFVALAGTGSDVFFIPGDKAAWERDNAARNRDSAWESPFKRTVVGAWGPILGDDGGGVWMGQQAVRRAIAGLEGWAEPTAILDLIRRDWNLEKDWDMVDLVYRSPAPFRKVGSLTKIIGEAAAAGDGVARGILTEAGALMAKQTACLAGRFNIPEPDMRLVTCGGAWKSHPLMFESFRGELASSCPELNVRLHRFEHVMAGPAIEMLKRERAHGPEPAPKIMKRQPARVSEPAPNILKRQPARGPDAAPDKTDGSLDSASAAERRLAELFPEYVINWRYV
jgi:N-acetylglucosamine kinase-like BadF-type ATPase